MGTTRPARRILSLFPIAGLVLSLGAASVLLGVCGPFTDVTDATFCPFVLEIFTLGITTGTSPTTYDPSSPVSRLQMAAFLSRSVDGVLRRGSRRVAVSQNFSPQNAAFLGVTTVGSSPAFVRTDGADLWVTNSTSVSRVRASDGKLLETWPGATTPRGILVAMGQVFASARTDPGQLYKIDPRQAAGTVTTVATNLGNSPNHLSSDGARIWSANGAQAGTGSVSIVTPGATIPWTVTNVSTGFSTLNGIVFDGSNIWVADSFPSKLHKLDSTGAIVQTVSVGSTPLNPVFDGTNIWVPNAGSNTVSVVRASTGVVLDTLTANGLDFPTEASFDGQRILVTNQVGQSVSLWKAADLTPLQSVATGAATAPFGACSDGQNFWIVLSGVNSLARF